MITDTSRQTAKIFKEKFPGHKLLVVSNRAPYEQSKSNKLWKKPAGGVTSALDPLLQSLGGTWIAWDGFVDGKGGKIPVPPGNPNYTMRLIPLSSPEVEGYYHGFSNQVLWPLCHLLVERVSAARRSWVNYLKVNLRFARAAAKEISPGDVVWVQDYHLTLLPRLLRQLQPQAHIAHFWHIPWPPPEVFQLCPQKTRLIRGLLGSDLLGFHIPQYANNFLNCAAAEPDIHVDMNTGQVDFRGHSTRVGAFPISIDYGHFLSIAQSESCNRRLQLMEMKLNLKNKLVGLGVDRLDYTKGILHRLIGLEVLFHRYPHLRGKVTFIQVAVPSREGIEDYRQLSEDVVNTVQEINNKYSRGNWQPIHLIHRGLDQQILASLYRRADFALVSSLYDGMNLVAKEYVACQQGKKSPGVLILSQTAGAYHQLAEALPVNPLDAEEIASAIYLGITMPAEERFRRMETMQEQIKRQDIYWWAQNILSSLAETVAEKRQGK